MDPSPKPTSFWQGPFEILQICSDYTYLVLCGFAQVMHVDRMGLVKPQLLAGEGTLKGLEPPQCDELDTQNYSVGIHNNKIEGDTIVEGNYLRIVKNRRAPAYLSDYVFDMYD